jgi:hypothetical protein
VRDLESGRLLDFRSGSVSWNPYRKKWIMIAEESRGGAFSGETWYAEAPLAVGPWRTARKVVSHNRQSFYNPVHHPFFDQDGGRLIYFEGTYADTTPGAPEATPRYDGNVLMYRLDLSDERLHEPAGWKPPAPAEAKADELRGKP